MSSALGGRMKQRFDLIGYEKVSHSSPVGRAEGYRGKRLAHPRTDAQSFDLSVWLSSLPLRHNFPTSVSVQNKHALIGQLITGMNKGSNTLIGPLWLHLVLWLLLCLCVYVCVCDSCVGLGGTNWCSTRGNIGQHPLWVLHRPAIAGLCTVLHHTYKALPIILPEWRSTASNLWMHVTLGLIFNKVQILKYMSWISSLYLNIGFRQAMLKKYVTNKIR